MTSAGGPPNPPKSRVTVYIDGFNLYYGLKNASEASDREHLKHGGSPAQCLGRSLYWLDIHRFIMRHVRSRETCTQIRYYTAARRVPELVAVKPSQRAAYEASNKRQEEFLAALRTLPLMKVVMGWYTENTPHLCWMCGHTRAHFEEKETDVNIAVDMVSDAHKNLYDTAIVLSADSDLAAGLKAVKALGKRVRLILAPGRKRADLLRSIADEVVTLKIKSVRNFRLPDKIARQGQPDLVCPDRWMPGGWVRRRRRKHLLRSMLYGLRWCVEKCEG